jgi:RNA polymerase sigma-70 factor (ECF subfamily)
MKAVERARYATGGTRTMSDAQLATALEAAQMGSSDAFGRVYGQFAGRVFGLCRKILGTHAAAEDATSEVFERARGALDQYDRARPFDRWLMTVASRYCLNLLRRQRTERRLFSDEELDTPAPAGTASPLVACEAREQRAAVRTAIEALPERYRIVLILKYYGELSYDEIALHLGTTRTNVAVLLHRAKRDLRGRIDTRGEDAP